MHYQFLIKITNYTKEELEALRIISLKRSRNKTIYNEMKNIEKNIEKVHDLKFPGSVPVLNLVSVEMVKRNPVWEQLHRDVVTESARNKFVLLEGNHILYHDNKKECVKEIKEFIN